MSRETRRFTNGRGEGLPADGYAGSNLTSWTGRDGTPGNGRWPSGWAKGGGSHTAMDHNTPDGRGKANGEPTASQSVGPALVDGPVEVYLGDALDVLRQLPSDSVHCVVTSPPYWGLRDYGSEAVVMGGDAECQHEWGAMERGKRKDILPAEETTLVARTGLDERQNGAATNGGRFCTRCSAWLGALGLEPTPALYIEHLVEIFREVKRVLRRDGTCWLNLGDSYAASRSGPVGDRSTLGGSRNHRDDVANGRWAGRSHTREQFPDLGIKNKDLIGMPWMVAFALRSDGWWLRSDICWAKPNPMPESVTDRPTKSHEYLFVLAKSDRYYWDLEAVREKSVSDHPSGNGYSRPQQLSRGGRGQANTWTLEDGAAGRNMRDVWTIATQPYAEAHFATYPDELVMPCIKAGTSEHGVCSVCGAPRRRVVATERTRDGIPVQGLGAWRNTDKAAPSSAQGDGHWRYATESATLGWQRTCTHDALAVPATVLDPFAGSGTTLAVARRLGRRSVGIELNPSYVELIRRRVADAAVPLLEAPAEPRPAQPLQGDLWSA